MSDSQKARLTKNELTKLKLVLLALDRVEFNGLKGVELMDIAEAYNYLGNFILKQEKLLEVNEKVGKVKDPMVVKGAELSAPAPIEGGEFA